MARWSVRPTIRTWESCTGSPASCCDDGRSRAGLGQGGTARGRSPECGRSRETLSLSGCKRKQKIIVVLKLHHTYSIITMFWEREMSEVEGMSQMF